MLRRRQRLHSRDLQKRFPTKLLRRREYLQHQPTLVHRPDAHLVELNRWGHQLRKELNVMACIHRRAHDELCRIDLRQRHLVLSPLEHS